MPSHSADQYLTRPWYHSFCPTHDSFVFLFTCTKAFTKKAQVWFYLSHTVMSNFFKNAYIVHFIKGQEHHISLSCKGRECFCALLMDPDTDAQRWNFLSWRSNTKPSSHVMILINNQSALQSCTSCTWC